MATTFRLAQQGDAPGLLARMARESAVPHGERQLAALLVREWLHSGGDHRLWIIQRDGETAGFVLLELAEHGWRGLRILEVAGAWLMPGQRGQGLMAAAIRFLQELGRAPGNYPLVLGAERAAIVANEHYHRGRYLSAAAHTGKAA